MNKIKEVTRGTIEGERCLKFFEVLVPVNDGKIEWKGSEEYFAKGVAVVVPPLIPHTITSFYGIRVEFEQAVLPFKDISVVFDDEQSGIAHACTQALNYVKSENSKKSTVLTALGDLIAAYLIAFSSRVNTSPVVTALRADILKGVSDCAFVLDDHIKKLPLNYDYVRKLFKRETGVSPHEFLLSERMKLARQLLESGISNRYSNYTVSQIAESCGFTEPLYFSRVFKKYFGISPSRYLKTDTSKE